MPRLYIVQPRELGTALAFVCNMGKLSLYTRQHIVNLHQLGKNVLFSDKYSVNIEQSTRRYFHKVGESHRLKGKPKHRLKVSLHFLVHFCPLSSLVPNPSTTYLLPFPYLSILAAPTDFRCKQESFCSYSRLVEEQLEDFFMISWGCL